MPIPGRLCGDPLSPGASISGRAAGPKESRVGVKAVHHKPAPLPIDPVSPQLDVLGSEQFLKSASDALRRRQTRCQTRSSRQPAWVRLADHVAVSRPQPRRTPGWRPTRRLTNRVRALLASTTSGSTPMTDSDGSPGSEPRANVRRGGSVVTEPGRPQVLQRPVWSAMVMIRGARSLRAEGG